MLSTILPIFIHTSSISFDSVPDTIKYCTILYNFNKLYYMTCIAASNGIYCSGRFDKCRKRPKIESAQ